MTVLVGQANALTPRRNPVRGRFAPSPTGALHFGSLIAALGSFLDMRQRGGEWWVRVEDLDPPRTVPGATDQILRALDIYGLHWDGEVAYQSQRHALYHAALEQLHQRDLTYPCSCSRREIARNARAGTMGLIYSGDCRNGVRHPERPTAIRVCVADRSLTFHDAIQGDYCQHLREDVGDFVLCRADGLFAYQLAVVVDDAAQGMTDIMRGSDLLDSTPRQIYLQELLDFPTPDYAHLPVVVHPNGDKLSKQTGAIPLDLQQPSATLVSALRFLGQNPPSDLGHESPATILDWGCTHWCLEQVPKRLHGGADLAQINELIPID